MDLNADVIEVYSEPGPQNYEKVSRFSRGERVVSGTLPDLVFDVTEALPPEE